MISLKIFFNGKYFKSKQTELQASFSSLNRPLELNDYSYGVIITLFDRNLFLRIVISVGITIFL
jgi:hypothetical protein